MRVYPTSIQTTAFGMVLMAAVMVHQHLIDSEATWFAGTAWWLGCLLVIVGVGRILFLD